MFYREISNIFRTRVPWNNCELLLLKNQFPPLADNSRIGQPYFIFYLFIYLFILYTLFQFGLTIAPIQNTALSNAKYNNALYIYIFFFSIWVFFHEHSRITGLQGKGEGISLTPHSTSTRFTDTWTLAGRLLQRAHLCT